LNDGIFEAGKKLEGRALVVLLPHEKQWSVRRKQQKSRSHFSRADGNQRGEPLAVCAIANLVVILDADDLRGKRHALGRCSTWTSLPELKRLTLEHVGL